MCIYIKIIRFANVKKFSYLCGVFLRIGVAAYIPTKATKRKNIRFYENQIFLTNYRYNSK